MINLRKAELSDLRAISTVDALSFKDDSYPLFVLRQLLDITPTLVWVAELETTIVGYTIGHYNAETSEGWILSLGVNPDLRGRQIGEKLTSKCTNALAEKGAEKVYLTVHPENIAAQRVYTKSGFKEHEKKHDYYLDNSPRIVMVKELA